jgi:hypothetical protein
MHPLFKELFINTDDVELQADEERHRTRRTRRNRSRMLVTVRSRTTAPPTPRGSSG